MNTKIKLVFTILKAHKRSILVFLIFAIMAMGIGVKDRMEAQELAGKVERGAEGGSTQSQTFTFQLEDYGDRELTIDVAPVERPEDEAKKLLEEAYIQWRECYLGENASLEEVQTDLTLPEEFCDGLVFASYESSNLQILQTDGVIVADTLPEEGTLVELTVTFSCESYSRIEECTLRVIPPEKGTAAWLQLQLQNVIQQMETETRQDKIFDLPNAIEGYTVHWKVSRKYQWMLFLFLGVAAAVCLERRDKEIQRTREKKRLEKLVYEYPGMVDQMVVLLESGMTIRRAWTKMTERRKNQEGPVPEYQREMQITLREIQEGRGEQEAYERFGNRIGLLPYRRFSSVLSQNLSRGNRDIRQLLRKEAAEALEMRKNRAKKAGEEAGTKMLFPMLAMLVMILIVLLLPALSGLI